MALENKKISIEDAIQYADIDRMLMKRRSNNMLLNDYQISVLDRCGINYLNFSDMKNLLFMIEDYLNDEFDEELEMVSGQISEYVYYFDSRK